jgi:uncharacterized protein (DUF433 family)
MDYHQYIVRDPRICGGEPIIKENLPLQLHSILKRLAHDVGIVPHEGLSGRDDLITDS